MKSRKSIQVILLSVMSISTLLNVLYLVDVVAENYFRVGFIVTMLSVIVMNNVGSNGVKGIFSREKGAISESILFRVITIILSLCWLITLFLAMFEHRPA